MRLEGRIRGGYYLAPHAALDAVLPLLVMPKGQPVAICDPCAGEGLALRHLAERLGVPNQQLYAIELEENRGVHLAENLPGANILTPCSFFGCRIASRSMSLIYANPPFDDSGDGSGRVERQFLDRATPMLKADGVLMLICPERVALDWDTRRSLLTWYDRIYTMPFPEEHRNFDEVIVLAVKRSQPANPDKRGYHDDTGVINYRGWGRDDLEPEPYVISPGSGPQQRFEKSQLTPREILDLLDSSPLRQLLETPAEPPLPSPPLELGTGHLALLLASGQLDGLVCPEGEPPHVVRGTVKKVEDVSDVQVDETETSTRTTTTITEHIRLAVRVVGIDGVIRTLTQGGDDDSVNES